MGMVSFVELQASADVRPRVRETVVRVRVRHATLSAVVRVTPNVQQLHDMLPFILRRLRAVEANEWRSATDVD